MFRKLTEFAQTTGGRVAAILIIAIGVGFMFFSVRNFARSEGSALTNERPYICAETGKTFTYKVKLGDTFPVESPYSGKRTGYHAEACFWTKDGKIKREPTYVLLNKYANKTGPTFCPDCGRLVREMNDPPMEGATPPPTEEEMKTAKAKIKVREDE
ncbi:MAG: hypothetical protein QOE14_2226 [Humisphaera sp.]|nr:hypothetical protein [Humisphaera sp.]